MNDVINNPGVRVCRKCGGEMRGLVCHDCGTIGNPAEGYAMLYEILKGRTNEKNTEPNIQQPE